MKRILHIIKNIRPPVHCPKCRRLTTIMVIDKGNGIRICFECAVYSKWLS